MSDRSYFPMFYFHREAIEQLTGEEVKEFIMAMYDYSQDGVLPANLSHGANIVFRIVKPAVDSSRKRYEDMCEKNRENGRKGGRPRMQQEPTETQINPTVATETQITQDKDKDKDKDQDKERIYKGAKLDKPIYAQSSPFDFDIVIKQIKSVYPSLGEDYPYSEEEVAAIFETYYKYYRKYMGCEHPNLSTENIKQIAEKLPYVDDSHRCIQDIEPTEYEELISKHFRTKYKNCDYNINHFVSGYIRELRSRE